MIYTCTNIKFLCTGKNNAKEVLFFVWKLPGYLVQSLTSTVLIEEWHIKVTSGFKVDRISKGGLDQGKFTFEFLRLVIIESSLLSFWYNMENIRSSTWLTETYLIGEKR